jgi:hypothetical protein
MEARDEVGGPNLAQLRDLGAGSPVRARAALGEGTVGQRLGQPRHEAGDLLQPVDAAPGDRAQQPDRVRMLRVLV